MRPSADVMSSGEAGFASTQTEVNESSKGATTSDVPAACTVHCTVEIPESQFSGWRPVWITAKLDTARRRERKTPKGVRQGRVGGGNRVCKNHPRSHFLVLTFVWGCHSQSPANSLREVSQVSLQLTTEGRGLPGNRYQFWGAAPVRAPRGRIATSVLDCRYTTTSNTTQPSGVKGLVLCYSQLPNETSESSFT